MSIIWSLKTDTFVLHTVGFDIGVSTEASALIQEDMGLSREYLLYELDNLPVDYNLKCPLVSYFVDRYAT